VGADSIASATETMRFHGHARRAISRRVTTWIESEARPTFGSLDWMRRE
jgi:hypothetical protein